MKTEIKICGLRRIEDALMVNEFPEIKYVGLVFAESKRKIDVMDARAIVSKLRDDIKVVGVFANMDSVNVNIIEEQVGLDIIQLHSNENNQMCSEFDCKVWKSIAVKNTKSLKIADEYFFADGFVLDTYSDSMHGGIGKKFDWDNVVGFSDKKFTVLAGGIDASNIVQAIDIVKPHVVDLSSSVEIDGFKNYEKLKELIEAYRKGSETDEYK